MLSYIKSAAAAVHAAASTVASNAATQLQQHPILQIGNRSIQIKQQLGEGGFAFVYECVSNKNVKSANL